MTSKTLLVLTTALVVVGTNATAQTVRFNDIDQNRDGVLSLAELQAQFGNDGASRYLRDADRDGDGNVTLREARRGGDDSDDRDDDDERDDDERDDDERDDDEDDDERDDERDDDERDDDEDDERDDDEDDERDDDEDDDDEDDEDDDDNEDDDDDENDD